MNEHKAFLQIETERLLLRPWRESDRAPWAAMNADPQVREYFPGTLSRKQSDTSIDLFMKRLARDGFCFWAVEEKATGAFVGFTGLSRTDFQAAFTPCVEVGWRLARSFWGRGFASEAALASLDYGFNTLRLAEIVAFAPARNLRSRLVMERIGMTRDPDEDFIHPKMPTDHPLQPCVLYRAVASARAFVSPTNTEEETVS